MILLEKIYEESLIYLIFCVAKGSITVQDLMWVHKIWLLSEVELKKLPTNYLVLYLQLVRLKIRQVYRTYNRVLK